MCDGHTSGDFGCQKCAKSILERKHGWIECMSTSFPGKIYYFHTMTRCSTWQRPVPRETKLPRYKKLRDSRSFEPPMDDQILPSPLGVSETESSFFSSENSPSDFELHARRMQIYLQKNTNYNLSMKYYGRSDIILRDKLLECYKRAKSKLAKNLKQKKKPATEIKTLKVTNVREPKTTRLMDPVKTIRECHGIKTISYDPIPPELPIGVDKMPDLSETSIDSIIQIQGFEKSDIIDDNNSRRQGHGEGIAGHDQNFGQSLVFKDLNLSESETTENVAAEFLSKL